MSTASETDLHTDSHVQNTRFRRYRVIEACIILNTWRIRMYDVPGTPTRRAKRLKSRRRRHRVCYARVSAENGWRPGMDLATEKHTISPGVVVVSRMLVGAARECVRIFCQWVQCSAVRCAHQSACQTEKDPPQTNGKIYAYMLYYTCSTMDSLNICSMSFII